MSNIVKYYRNDKFRSLPGNEMGQWMIPKNFFGIIHRPM
jgi:hypothetical protein